jgi:DNA polymerase III alpha subunit (gram-positive type)
VAFDLSFLNAALEEQDRPLLENLVVDTLALARRLVPEEVPGWSTAPGS